MRSPDLREGPRNARPMEGHNTSAVAQTGDMCSVSWGLSRTCVLVGTPQAQERVYRSQWSSRPKLCLWAMRTEAARVCQTPRWPQISEKWEKALMSPLWLIHQNKWNSTQLSQFSQRGAAPLWRTQALNFLFFLCILIPV